MFTKKVQVILASFFQPENHGPGRKISIAAGKPKDTQCEQAFPPLSPDQLYWDYMKNKKDPEAGRIFAENYQQLLDAFKEDVLQEAKENNISIFEVLPFEDGDTLLSWEHKGHMTYRRMVAACLKDLGYDVIEN